MKLDFENLSDAIFHHAKTKPDHPAIVDAPYTFTYGELANLIESACHYLQQLGIRENDRVGLVLDNHADHVILMFALMRMGATPIEMSTEIELDTQNLLINQLDIKALFVECSCKAGKDVPIREVVNFYWRKSLNSFTQTSNTRSNKKAEDNKLVMLTSGTTGTPKSIVSSHQQRLERARAHANLLRDVWSDEKPGNALILIPLTHAGPHQFLLNQILAGGTSHILPKYIRSADIVRALGSYENAVCFVTISISRALLANRDAHVPFLPNAQVLISGGQGLGATQKLEMIKYITPHFYESYGASGYGLICGLTPEEMIKKPHSVGKPSNNIEIVNAQNEKVAHGVIGYVRCKGNSKASGYLTANNSTTELFRDEWYYPGDIGCIDEDGYLVLKGRQADVINSNGVEIYPSEIEEILMAHPAVEEAVVVGLRVHPQAPLKPAAVVVLREGTLEPIQFYCAEKLPVEKRPTNLIRAHYIKKTAVGKVDRAAVIQFAIDAIRKTAQINAIPPILN